MNLQSKHAHTGVDQLYKNLYLKVMGSIHLCNILNAYTLPMTFDYRFLKIGLHPSIHGICMFTLQINPQKVRKASGPGGEPVILNDDGKVELLDSFC